MDKRVFIVVEGINDIIFLKDFIEIHYGFNSSTKVKNSTIEIELELKNNKIIIYQLFGKDPDSNVLKNLEQRINNFIPTEVICIFDADDNIENAKDNLKTMFSFYTNITENNFYLFPNNQDEGDLEVFLEQIIVNKNIMDCWDSFEDCIVMSDNKLTLPARKSKIHTYLEILNPNTKMGKENCKEINRNYKDKTKWNLNDTINPTIGNLLSFLNQYIK